MVERFQDATLIAGTYDHYQGREPMQDNRAIGILDLDRCLLDTNAYTAELVRHAASAVGPEIDPELEIREVLDNRGYYIPVFGGEGTQNAYSFQHHIRSMLGRARGVAPDQIDDSLVLAIRTQVRESFPDATRFLYPGASETAATIASVAEPRILTFGIQEDQEDKLARLPTLGHIPYEIIQTDKAEFIANKLKQFPRIYLADDRDYGGMPENCFAIQVDHTGKLQRSKNGIPVVHNLQDAAARIIEEEKRHHALAA